MQNLKSAKQLNDEEINNIKKDLTENFGTNLKLNFEHDPSLIGFDNTDWKCDD